MSEFSSAPSTVRPPPVPINAPMFVRVRDGTREDKVVKACDVCASRPPSFRQANGRHVCRTCALTPPDVRPPGRNAACPCGSGKKYKKCCKV